MSNKIVDFHVNKNICEAVACFAKATTKIDVRVDKGGVISLDLCRNCVTRFVKGDVGINQTATKQRMEQNYNVLK